DHVSDQPQEVEGVLLVRAGDQDAAGERVAALEAVDRFELRARPAQRIRDVYLDTGDGALAGARVAFRVRELDGRPLLTLKADPVRSGLAAERLELEAPWSAEALRTALEELWRRGVDLPTPRETAGAGEPLADLAGLGLRPTQIRDTTRTPRDVVERDGGPVAELTVDDVAYQLPAGRARLLEVEVEAKGPGGMETVQTVLGALAEAFPDDLRPWPYGKLATGRAVEQLLAEGRLEGMLDADGRIRPAAHELLAEFLAENSP
ncbi:MAG TPA: CYTH domain-containing protein, partial [Actinomycetes bacterium]|nr:CYTH domain-containing protein [Actinomycetes bacterium]